MGVGVVRRPLRQPGAQRRKARQPDGAVVGGLGHTHEAGADRPVIGLDAGVQKARLGHGAVGHEAALQLVAAPALERVQRVPDPCRAAAHARQLRRTKAHQEFGAVRRLEGRVVQVQFRVTYIGVVLVEHTGIDPVGKGHSPRDMRRLEDECIGRLQPRRHDVAGVARGRVRDAGALGLRLVHQRQRAAARPAGQHHLFIAPDLARVAHIGAQVHHHVFHDESAVVARVAAACAQHVHAALGHGARHGQQLQRGGRVHVDHQGLRVTPPGRVADAFQMHRAQRPGKTIDRLEGRLFGKLDVNPLGLGFVLCGHGTHALATAPVRVAFSCVHALSAARASRR